jgi:hypothetical protein
MLRMLQRLNIHKKKYDKIANDNFPEINAFLILGLYYTRYNRGI